MLMRDDGAWIDRMPTLLNVTWLAVTLLVTIFAIKCAAYIAIAVGSLFIALRFAPITTALGFISCCAAMVLFGRTRDPSLGVYVAAFALTCVIEFGAWLYIGSSSVFTSCANGTCSWEAGRISVEGLWLIALIVIIDSLLTVLSLYFWSRFA
jgi:hypothetical protein